MRLSEVATYEYYLKQQAAEKQAELNAENEMSSETNNQLEETSFDDQSDKEN